MFVNCIYARAEVGTNSPRVRKSSVFYTYRTRTLTKFVKQRPKADSCNSKKQLIVFVMYRAIRMVIEM